MRLPILVRAVSLRYLRSRSASTAASVDAAMWKDYLGGFILERFFYEQLAAYERQERSLAAFYPQMVARLAPAMELSRWLAARASK